MSDDSSPDWATAPSWAKSPTAAAPVAQPPPGVATRGADGAFIAEPVLQMATGLVAKPLSDFAGLKAMMRNVVMGEQNDPQAVKNRVQNENTYEPKTPEGKAVAEKNPIALVGKAVHGVADATGKVIKGDSSNDSIRGVAGNAAREGIEQAPGLLGVKGGKAAEFAGSSMKDSAKGWMQSALKPTVEQLRTGKAEKAIDTLLKDGINVSPGGVKKMQGKIDELDGKISDMIDNSPASISKTAVGRYLHDAFQKFSKQVNPTSDVHAIQRAWEEFMDHPLLNGDLIPVKTAQELKQGTYRSLGNKAYGELKGADIEAMKGLAYGLKEEIAKVVPAVKPLNAEQSKLLNALDVTERRVLMDANKNPIGLGWFTTDPVKMAGWMADRSPLFKSLVARMVNTGADVVPLAATPAKTGGIAVSQQAQQRAPTRFGNMVGSVPVAGQPSASDAPVVNLLSKLYPRVTP
jgi:hypothetical protein